MQSLDFLVFTIVTIAVAAIGASIFNLFERKTIARVSSEVCEADLSAEVRNSCEGYSYNFMSIISKHYFVIPVLIAAIYILTRINLSDTSTFIERERSTNNVTSSTSITSNTAQPGQSSGIVFDKNVHQKNYPSLVQQVSAWSNIPEQSLLSMDPAYFNKLAQQWEASNLGTTTDQVKTMSPSQRLDEDFRQIAEKYGVSYSDVKRSSEIQDKMDAGQPLTVEETATLRDITQRISRRRR